MTPVLLDWGLAKILDDDRRLVFAAFVWSAYDKYVGALEEEEEEEVGEEAAAAAAEAGRAGCRGLRGNVRQGAYDWRDGGGGAAEVPGAGPRHCLCRGFESQRAAHRKRSADICAVRVCVWRGLIEPPPPRPLVHCVRLVTAGTLLGCWTRFKAWD